MFSSIIRYFKILCKIFLLYSLYFLVYFYNKPICRQSFCDFRKKDPRPKWTIYKYILDKSQKCLFVGNSEFCLSSSSLLLSVVCVLAPGYTNLCRGLKYLRKVWYIILVDLLCARFLIIETVFLIRTATLPYV